MNKTVDTRICEVTVYNDQALVTRRGVVQLTGEEHELVVAQLPATLVSESVRVSGKGKASVQLLGVETKRTSALMVMQEQATQMAQEIAQIEEQKRQGQDQQALLNLQRNFVKSLSTQYLERITKSSCPDALNFEQIRELMDFVGQQYSELSNAIATSDKDQKQLDKQLQALRGQISTSSSQESVSIIITLDALTAGEFELEVSYIVNQASWMPLYNLRLNATSEIINISGLAEVKQSSGEDWFDVALTLSTTKPGIGSLPSKLLPWYIDVQQFNQPGHKAKAAEFNSIPSRVLSTTMPFPGMSPLPEAAIDAPLASMKAQKATAEVFKYGGIISYKASNSGNIKSDGTTHKTTIFNEDYHCGLDYIAIPRRSRLAYLQATITIPLSGITLLPGKANIFRENTFIGTIELDKIAPGQEFKLNLGIDEGLKIERNLVEHQVDKKLMGDQWRTTYAYQLVITNLREYGAQLTLIEQLPVSRNEQIKVQLTRSHPQIETGEMGLLEWSLPLLPLSSQELYYQFTVEHPPELVVVGLDI